MVQLNVEGEEAVCGVHGRKGGVIQRVTGLTKDGTKWLVMQGGIQKNCWCSEVKTDGTNC